MSTEIKSISSRLRDIRIYYGYKQTEIANSIGICRNVYCEYEHYKRIIPLKRLVALANFYGINIDYLLGLTDIRKEIKKSKIDKYIISNRLKEIRKINNLSVSELAKILKVSHSLIYFYESCEKLISTSVCYSISKKFNISVDYLLGRTDTKFL